MTEAPQPTELVPVGRRGGEREAALAREGVALDAGGERDAAGVFVVVVRMIRVDEGVGAVVERHADRAHEGGAEGDGAAAGGDHLIERERDREEAGGGGFLVGLEGALEGAESEGGGRGGEFAEENLREETGGAGIVDVEEDAERKAAGRGGAGGDGGLALDIRDGDIADPEAGERGGARGGGQVDVDEVA
jgi:hypothetical protein